MNKFMQEALKLAEIARKKDEVPVGAIIVKDGKIIAKGYNKRERKQNALLHAEIVAINKACKKLKSFRLIDCELYVTLEPCPMCAGAIINSRIGKVYFGAYDQKRGCAGSIYNLLSDPRFNHNPEVTGGIIEEECAKILTTFFETKR
ncbi:MAG: tRNA adenosine(34) deaminase TadA [Christensenellaceae bacterium]|jgi:tRNA(adenine34) deaminase|nr:tRNA adenosine(34) deaminase TadA [Christensenellaceae bacterium]